MTYTDITFILDRSGSMSTCQAAMNEAFDGFIARQKDTQGKVLVSLKQFDTEFQSVYSALPLELVPASNLVPGGGTALLDAIVRSMDETANRINALPKPEQPDQVLMIIITDGQENSSITFGGLEGRNKVFNIITERRNKDQWEFIYLGANQDAIAEATKLGISASNTANYVSTGAGQYGKKGVTGKVDQLSSTVSAYRASGKKTMDANLDADELPDWVNSTTTKGA